MSSSADGAPCPLAATCQRFRAQLCSRDSPRNMPWAVTYPRLFSSFLWALSVTCSCLPGNSYSMSRFPWAVAAMGISAEAVFEVFFGWGKSMETGSLLRAGWFPGALFHVGCQQPTPSYPKGIHSCLLKPDRCFIPFDCEDFRMYCKWRQILSCITKVYHHDPRCERCCHILGWSPHTTLEGGERRGKKKRHIMSPGTRVLKAIC